MKQICGEEENRNLFLVNDCPDMFTAKCLGNISLLHPIDDLNLTNDLAILENLKAGTLYNQIVQVFLQKLFDFNLFNELCIWVLLGVIGIKSFLIFNKDTAPGTDQVGQDE